MGMGINGLGDGRVRVGVGPLRIINDRKGKYGVGIRIYRVNTTVQVGVS